MTLDKCEPLRDSLPVCKMGLTPPSQLWKGSLGARSGLGLELQVCPEQQLLCVALQLCEDLFSRVHVNQNAQLSYSVEVSPSLGAGRQEAWYPWTRM